MTLVVVPLELSEANTLVSMMHRHHAPCVGHRFSIGCVKDGKLVGAAIVGRPVARLINHREVCEVSRLVTDGTKNACSILYAAAALAAAALGYMKIQTYILDTEIGTSLVASGWTCEGSAGGGDWNTKKRVRRTDQPMSKKTRWSKNLNPPHPEFNRPVDVTTGTESMFEESLFDKEFVK